MADWGMHVAATGVSLSPWLTEIKKIPLHFSPPQLKNLKEVNNILATVFAGAIYTYVTFSLPSVILGLLSWWYYWIIAGVCAVGMLILLLWKKSVVNTKGTPWPAVLHSILYITMFCLVTLSFGQLNILKEYVPIYIAVYDSKTDAPLPAFVSMQKPSGADVFKCHANENGKASVILDRVTFENISNCHLVIMLSGYITKRRTIIDGNDLFNYLKMVKLDKSQ